MGPSMVTLTEADPGSQHLSGTYHRGLGPPLGHHDGELIEGKPEHIRACICALIFAPVHTYNTRRSGQGVRVYCGKVR